MAAALASLFVEEARFGTVLNRTAHVCPQMLSALYTAHYHHVLKVCRRFFRQREDAEDAAAEVFLKLHTVLDKKDETSPFRPWVSQVANRHCIDKLRRRKREREACQQGIDMTEIPDRATPTPLTLFLRQEKHRLVRDQLERLPELYKAPLKLRYYQRMSYAEIARALNRGLPSIKMVIYRAKCQLRRNLQETKEARA